MSDQQKNARFALAVLFGINLMNFFDRQIAGALAEPIRVEFGLNDTQLGVVSMVFTLIYAVVGVPLGRLTDGWLRTRLVAIGVTFWSLLTAASGVAWNYTSFLVARMGVGVGEARHDEMRAGIHHAVAGLLRWRLCRRAHVPEDAVLDHQGLVAARLFLQAGEQALAADDGARAHVAAPFTAATAGRPPTSRANRTSAATSITSATAPSAG